MIPNNISKENIVNAINEIDRKGIPEKRESEKYFLVYNDFLYPPKYVISLANRFANTKELEHTEFSGGEESNKFLNGLGFHVVNKPSPLQGQKWLVVTSKENWRVCLQNRVFGVDENRANQMKKVRQGDHFLIYLVEMGMKIAAICRASSDYYYEESKLWKNGIFPHRVKFDVVNIAQEPIDIKKVYDIYFGYKGKSGGYFAQAIRPIPDNEFSIFQSEFARSLNELTEWNESNSVTTDEEQIQYFLVQVSKLGSDMLKNSIYRHSGWDKTPHDKDHGRVRKGDLLLVYFASGSPVYKMQLKKIYRVTSVSDKNIQFTLSQEKELNGLLLKEIRDAFNSGKLRKEVFKKLSQEGFNIKKIEKSDYDDVIALDNEKKPHGDIIEANLWLVRAGDEGQGEQIALQKNLIAIGYDGLPGLESIKDKKEFKQHYIDTHKTDKLGRVNSVVPQIWNFMNMIKNDDLILLPLKTQNSQLIAVGQIVGPYQYKDLNSEIEQFRPVRWLKKDVPRDEFDPAIRDSFNAQGTVYHIGGSDEVSKVNEVLKRLKVINEPTHSKRDWLSLDDQAIQEIIDSVLYAEGKRLQIDSTVLKRIISHLMLSKHVILVGPPGTGKTDLARRLLRELGKIIVGKTEPVEAVASYEWGRYEVIGGKSISSNSIEESFHMGCVVDAIQQGKLLLIDEFNRADMNKAFGEMFLAMDHGSILLREDEKPKGFVFDLNNTIKIPPEFRMICTMNDYDKSLLNDLSYGLLRRFAFVEINIPEDKEKIKRVVIERVKQHLEVLSRPMLENGLHDIETQIDKFLDFLLSIRERRQIGLASYIDVVRYMLFAVLITKTEPWKAINNALIDYIIPQFDRLDVETLDFANKSAMAIFIQDGKDTFSDLQPFMLALSDRLRRLQDLNKVFNIPEKL